MANWFSTCLLFGAATMFVVFKTAQGRLHCFQCATSTMTESSRQACLDGMDNLSPCSDNDHYCIVLRYTEEGAGPHGSNKVVLRRGCSPEFIGNYCQYHALSDGTPTSVCVSSCAEQACNVLPHDVNMDGQLDYFSKK